MKDPVWSKIVHIEVHTQLHSATLVLVLQPKNTSLSLKFMFYSNGEHFDPATKEQGDRLLNKSNRYYHNFQSRARYQS